MQRDVREKEQVPRTKNVSETTGRAIYAPMTALKSAQGLVQVLEEDPVLLATITMR
jgi:hypothetical protein